MNIERECHCGALLRWCGHDPANPEDDHDCHHLHCDNCGLHIDVDSEEAKNAETLDELKSIVLKTWNCRFDDKGK